MVSAGIKHIDILFADIEQAFVAMLILEEAYFIVI